MNESLMYVINRLNVSINSLDYYEQIWLFIEDFKDKLILIILRVCLFDTLLDTQ